MRQTIEEVCRELGLAQPGRIGDMLPSEQMKQLLRDNPEGVHLWVTNVFQEVIERIPPRRCFHFWKSEVQQRLMEDGGFANDMWPGRYAYLAQQWKSPFGEPLVQLMQCD
ncbi:MULTISPECIES: hypothetical protein [unclassified Inquilinus]|uniref:hypothetical protein n=1 Tax=unclassified Inquilinus TaxID=2645927 RepID=UPI003F8F1DF5